MTFKPISKKDIIDMAAQAGFTVGNDDAGAYVAPQYDDSIGTLERFAASVGFRVFESERVRADAELQKFSTENLTEAAIDAPRQFLLLYAGTHRAVRTAEMRRHLDMSGVDYSYWPRWAIDGDEDITKAGAAILIWSMMENEVRKGASK